MKAQPEGLHLAVLAAASIAFFMALTLAATLGVYAELGLLLRAFDWNPWPAALWAGLAIPLVLVCLKVLPRLAPTGLASPRALWLGLAAVALTRVAVALAVDAPLVSDFREYHDLAVGLVHGSPWFSELRPMGYPWLLATGYALFGVSGGVAEGLNVLGSLAIGAGLYAWVAAVGGRRAAAIALALYVLSPAQALMTAVRGTEIPYAALMVTVFACLARLEGARRPAALAGLAGAVLAFSHDVRPTSLAMVPACWLGFALLGRRRFVGPLLAFTCAFLIVLAPVARWNWQAHHTLSLSTSTYAGWSLLVGTNQASHGTWNRPDARLMAAYTESAARDRAARAEGIRRVTSDPLGFAGLVPRKFILMWAIEDYGAFWTYGTRDPLSPAVVAALGFVSQVFHVVTVGLGLVGLLAVRRRLGRFVPPLASLLTLAVVHAFLEVQPRYHFYWIPVLLGFAAIGIDALMAPRAARPEREAVLQADAIGA